MQTWPMQQAKAHMSELVQMAGQGPQEITVHGRPVAVVLSKRDFDQITAGQANLVSFMQSSPLRDLPDTFFQRDKSLARDIAL